jgi:hypothetical protein
VTDTPQPPPPILDPPALELLQQLVQRARQGDEASLPELRQALDAHPEIWRRYGDLARQAEVIWLDLAAGPDLLLRESLGRKLEELRAELAGPAPSPLEKLLVCRVVAGWLQVHYADAAYAQLRGGGLGPAQHASALKRQTAAQQGYLQAIRALATVRQLLRPPLSPVDLARGTVAEAPAVPRRPGRRLSGVGAG